MNRPNFVVIGAGRCGTTSLHQFLRAHPEVFVPERKSPNYFASHIPQPAWETPAAKAMATHWVTDPSAYSSLYDGVAGERAIGDVSPIYLQALDVAPRLHEECPDVRVVAILRDPAERAHAHWLGRRRDGIETTARFEDWVAAALRSPMPDDVAFGHYVACGRYHHFLSPFLERFGEERTLILFHEDLVADPKRVVAKLFGFLGADASFVPDLDARHNRSGVITGRLRRVLWTRSIAVRTALRPHLPATVRRAVGRRFLTELDRPTLDRSVRARLVDLLHDDISQLEQLTGRDLSHWHRG